MIELTLLFVGFLLGVATSGLTLMYLLSQAIK